MLLAFSIKGMLYVLYYYYFPRGVVCSVYYYYLHREVVCSVLLLFTKVSYMFCIRIIYQRKPPNRDIIYDITILLLLEASSLYISRPLFMLAFPSSSPNTIDSLRVSAFQRISPAKHFILQALVRSLTRFWLYSVNLIQFCNIL